MCSNKKEKRKTNKKRIHKKISLSICKHDSAILTKEHVLPPNKK
jgi:hypothetical protein